MPISIYPPTLASTQAAFVPDGNYTVAFALQNITSRSSIRHIQIRVVDQLSNSSIVSTNIYPDGIIYKNEGEIKFIANNTYSIDIAISDLKYSWTPGRCYKIQIRFGINDMYSSVSDFAEWKKQQINADAFSEWSNVMVIKAISNPKVEIVNAGELKQDTESKTNIENTTTPLFTGVYSIDENSKEQLDKYMFELFDETDELIETSDWLVSADTEYSYRFKTILENNKIYMVRFSIATVNGYTKSADYRFQVIKTYLDPIEGVEMCVEGNDSSYCRENGCLRVYLTGEEMSLTGCYVLTRTSELTNYGVYEDIKYFNIFEGAYDKNTPLYTDYTVESGVRYRYGFQYQNSQGLRSAMIEYTIPVSVDFEYSYIYRDGVQLKLSLNQKVNSFKHTVLTSKQDTLGGQFPYLSKNGYAHYAEFPITGTISYQMDKDDTFFVPKADGCYFKDELIIPKDKFVPEGERDSIKEIDLFEIDTNLTSDNIFIERKFREKVEEFLHDFDYKLYKSPTEGNIIIGLLNISMTPNATLGRMIFDFSATAYEVMENTLENLNETGIIDIGTYIKDSSIEEISQSFGQVSGIYSGVYSQDKEKSYPEDKNIYNLIKQQEEIIVGDGKYQMKLQQIDSIWIERYPEIDLSGKINELEALMQESIDKDEKAELEIEKDYYEGLKDAIANSAASNVVRLMVNNAEIVVAPNRYYAVEGGIHSLSVISSPYPIIVNYVVTLGRGRNSTAKEVASVDVSRVWGQISGVFTDDNATLQNYLYDYREGQVPYRVYSTNPSNEGAIEYEEDYAWDKTNGYYYVIVDSTNYNLYKTRNLYEIIKEETRKLVEHIYGVKEGFYQDDDGNWTNGTIYYSFSDIVSFTIEADPYTELLVGTSAENVKTILLGPTGRYTLSPMDGLIKYIELSPKAQFAIVDYVCLTSQTTMKDATEGE